MDDGGGAGVVDCSAACSLAAVAASSSGEKMNGTSPASLTLCVFLGIVEALSSLYLLDMALRLCICEPCGSSCEWRLAAEGVPGDLPIGLGLVVQAGPCEENGGDIEK